MSNATVRGLLFLICSGIVRLLQATTVDATARYSELCERFPELELPSTTPTFHVATSRDELQSAITTALSAAGDDVILLDGRTSQTWEGSSPITISGNENNGSIFIISQNPETGAFTQPVTFKGFGIAVGSFDFNSWTTHSSPPLYLANFAITNSATYSSPQYSAGISALGDGTIKGSCLSITNCGDTSLSRGGGLYILGPTITLYNTTITDNKTGKDGSSAYYGAVTNAGTSSVTLVHCTIAGNTGPFTYGSVTTTNCLTSVFSLPITSVSTAVPHCVPAASSDAIDAATATTSVKYDVLGNERIFGARADNGAVEYLGEIVVEPPADLVALPSGPREVYLGWSVISRARDYRLERSTDNGTTWENITNKTLWRTPYDATTNTEGTVMGWTSARYLEATPGETAQYRLSFAVAGLNDRITTTQTVTSPALDAYPLYHSRSGAKQVIYLDFTGYVDDYYGNVSAAQEPLENMNLTYIQTAPFEYNARFGDLSQPYPTASAIYDIWRMVAEDFAAFDVDVTTEAPTYDALVKSSETDMEYGKRVVIGYATGTSKPWYVGGGAFSGGGSFGFQHDRPVYIFSVQSRQNIAAQVTHEVSHTLGLAHDSGNIYLPTAYIQNADKSWSTVYDYFSPESQSYYQGVEITPDGTVHKSTYPKSAITWYPVMGAAPSVKLADNGDYYYDDADFMNQWNNGTYSSAGNQEDDFAILLGLTEGSGTAFTDKPLLYSAASRNIKLAEDEAGDTLTSAATLGTAQEGTPLTTDAVIGKHVSDTTVTNDVDLFSVTATTSGELTIQVVPNYLGLTEGSSLDAKVEVLNANGQCIEEATEPQWDADENYFNDIRNAVCTALLPSAGTYYVRVSGTNHPVSSTTLSADGSASESNPWHFNATDNAGSIGPYTLTTTFTAKEVEIVGDPHYVLAENGSATWLNNRLPQTGDNITIDFGTTSNQTVDLASILGNITQLGTITITGTNGGTMTHTTGITATNWSIAGGTTNAIEIPSGLTGSAQVKIVSGKATFSAANAYSGGTLIMSGATLTITHAQALGNAGNITGAGNLICNGVIPVNKNGLKEATWTGTVGLKVAFGDNADLTHYGNALSTIHFMQGATANYLAQAKTIPSAFILDGTITHNNGWSNNGGQIFSGAFSGSGTLATSNSPTDVIQITGNNPNFMGTLTVNGGHCVAFGTQTDDNNQTGKIVINKPNITIAAGKTWSAVNGTTITQNGSLRVNGSLSGAIANAGTITYLVETTPTNTYTGAGVIGVEATTLNLTRANLTSYTGTFAIANNGVLILPAGKEEGVTVETGCTLKLNLTPEQLASTYTSKATLNGGRIVFTQNNGTTEITDGVSNGSYTPPADLIAIWENGVWSQTPVTGSVVTITFSEGHTTCTFTNTEAIALGSLTIAGTTGGTICFANADVTVGAMTVHPSAVAIPVSLFNSFTATTYTVAQGKTLTLSGDSEITKTVNVYGTLALSGSMNFTGNNIVYNGGCLELLSGVTTFNTKNNDRGFQNGSTVKIAKDATLKNGVGDAPGYNKVTFDIAGTLEVTGTARWSLGSTAVITLREGACLKGAGGSGYNYAYDFFDGATITVKGNATIEGNIGSHKGNEINFNIANGKTLTLAGVYSSAVDNDTKTPKLKVSGEGTLQLMSENTYTGGTTIGNGATLTMGHRGALGTGNITLNGGTLNATSTATDLQLTVASGKTLAGTGTIQVPVAFAAGATLDATQGALTITGGVTTPESGTVTVQVGQYGNVLVAPNPNADSFALATDPDGLLLATETALVYTAKPTLPEGTTDVSDAALKQVAQLAAAEGIFGVTLKGAPLPNQQRTVDVAGVELFNNVTDLEKGENNTGVATVSYTFGIEHITVTTERKLVLTAKVDTLQTRAVVPTFVKNVRVDFYNGNTVIGSATVTEDNQSSLTITTDQTIDQLLGADESALDLTVKVSNEAPTEP